MMVLIVIDGHFERFVPDQFAVLCSILQDTACSTRLYCSVLKITAHTAKYCSYAVPHAKNGRPLRTAKYSKSLSWPATHTAKYCIQSYLRNSRTANTAYCKILQFAVTATCSTANLQLLQLAVLQICSYCNLQYCTLILDCKILQNLQLLHFDG